MNYRIKLAPVEAHLILEGKDSQRLPGNRCHSHQPGFLLKKPQKDHIMIISVPIDINLLLNLLRKFPWPRPDCCHKCNNPKLWGHGFVDSLFDFAKKAIPVKRYISGSNGFCGSASGCNVCYEIIYEFSGSGMTEMSSKDFPEPLPKSFFNS